MKVYIRSAESISPQKTFGHALFLDELAEYINNRLNCIEPDYSEAIDPKVIRRMSRIIKMSVATALACLKSADVLLPDAIITGTAYGCLEDTSTFLTTMVEFDEEPISPIAFVQSTHNTIGAQIALLLKCNGYNNTFVSGGISFENALLDAMMLLTADNVNVLVGGMDELTDISFNILNRSGLYKRTPVSNRDLYKQSSKGTIAGEGAAFFLLTNTPAKNNLACIDAVYSFYKPENLTETVQQVEAFLSSQAINSSDIDLLITGANGDEKGDSIYTNLQQLLFNGLPVVKYKNLCGEYPTATGFALWLGANTIKHNTVPDLVSHEGNVKENIRKVLIYNHYQNTHHSLILISAC